MITWQIDGLEELKAQLRSLPADLTNEARGIVESQAKLAEADIRNAYPQGPTGNLRAGVYVTHSYGDAGKYGAVAWVINRAKHAYIFEKGTQARHGAGGSERGEGSRQGNRLAFRDMMPPGNVFIPRAIKHRARMYQRLADMMRRYGLTVTYDAAA